MKEELIDDLVKRLEIERTTCFRIIQSSIEDFYKKDEDIQTGKIIAYNFCINELQKIIETQRQ